MTRYELAYKAGMEWVVFTCGEYVEASYNLYADVLGSSQGRAPRCASWFLEHVREVAGDNDMQVMVLEGGMKGWVSNGPQFTQFMDGFDPAYWQGQDGGTDKAQHDQALHFEPAQTMGANTAQTAESSSMSKRPLSTIQDEQAGKRMAF